MKQALSAAVAIKELAHDLIQENLGNIIKKWTMPIRDWKAALNRFTIQFEGRLPQS